MAEIVLGVGSSHSPMLATPVAMWADRLEGDRKDFSEEWDSLVAERAPWIGAELGEDVWARKHKVVEAAIDTLADTIRQASPDVLVVIGDDQDEMLPTGLYTPATIFTGSSVRAESPDVNTLPDFRRASLWSFFRDGSISIDCHPGLARFLVDHVNAEGFDVTNVDRQLPNRSIGHAFTWVSRRLLLDAPVPIVPVMLNTYFAQSQPSVARAFELGQAIGRAIRAWPETARVGIVASGGLSHRIVDQPMDEEILNLMCAGESEQLAKLEESRFHWGSGPCGTGESKNWIAVAGAMRESNIPMELIAYESLYRTPAGTGVGAAFGRWT